MRGPLLLLLSPMLLSAFASGQSPAPPSDTTRSDASLGGYSLVVTTLEPSTATHLLNPPLTIDIEAATESAPKEISGTRAIPAQYSIENFATPRFDCIAAGARDHGCAALDRSDLTIRGPNTVAWHFANHGGAVQLALNLLVHDISPVSQTTAQASWHAREVVFIAVPKATPNFHFVSAVMVGDWNGNAIVFEPGKPLPENAKKGLEDLGIHQDLGDKILYSYKVKDPK